MKATTYVDIHTTVEKPPEPGDILEVQLMVATMLRSPTRSLGILLPLLFLGSQGLGNVPGVKAFTQYLPDQAGMLIMHIVGPQDDPRRARDYGPWTGVGILALWAIAALLGGHQVLHRRDA
ncbi:hypothetical protein [Acrocarpospora sp. B8E8]|uniref:hypothetical protein n=1 Tax=Acrocarpospora sp. B8E8 TaxID=3153572 RepID=UPI00325CDE57